jgi:hypothetical protein
MKRTGWSGNKKAVSGRTTGVYGVFFSPCRQIPGYVQTDHGHFLPHPPPMQLRKGRQETLTHWENGRTGELIQTLGVRLHTATALQNHKSLQQPILWHSFDIYTFTINYLYVSVRYSFWRTALLLCNTVLSQLNPRHTFGCTANILYSLLVSLTFTTEIKLCLYELL